MKNTIRFGSLLLFVVSFGCMQSTPKAEKADSSTLGVTAEEATPRETIGKTTQNVLALDQALSEGAVLASTKVESKNPLMVSAEAYRTSVGKIGGMGVEKAIQLRNAQSIRDPKPLTHEEFMAEIIKKGQSDGIHLPMLPYYQEYAWDQPNQKLVVLDFPARKAEREKQR
jgi:hypothetical protein